MTLEKCLWNWSKALLGITQILLFNSKGSRGSLHFLIGFILEMWNCKHEATLGKHRRRQWKTRMNDRYSLTTTSPYSLLISEPTLLKTIWEGLWEAWLTIPYVLWEHMGAHGQRVTETTFPCSLPGPVPWKGVPELRSNDSTSSTFCKVPRTQHRSTTSRKAIWNSSTWVGLHSFLTAVAFLDIKI